MKNEVVKTKDKIKMEVESCGYIYIDNYIENKNRIKVVFKDKIGYKYDVYLHNLIRGHSPYFVDKSNPFSLENISLWLNLNNSQFKLSKDNEYKGSFSKLNLYCNKCKDYPNMSWNNIFHKIGCGICDGKQVGVYHNLASQRPDIAKEWHSTKNGNLTPRDVTYGEGIKVWWLCQFGHEYLSSINHRTSGKGCGICSMKQRESKVATELKNYILSKYHGEKEYPIFINPETNFPLPFDIYVFGGKNLNLNGVYIEIHGEHHYKIHDWHKRQSKKNKTFPEEEFEYQKHKDRLKRRFARKHGIYIEVDLREIKTTEQAIKYVESILRKNK
jgi:hypothetical protein